MTDFAKVKDHKGLIREMHSKAILNIDNQKLLEHRKNKQVIKNVMENNEKIGKLENDIEEIKNMLVHLTKKIKD